MKFVINIFLLSIISLLLLSCGQKAVYDKQVTIENGKWLKDNAAHFEVDIKDTTALYNFYLTLRHTTDYRYSNLYLFLSTQFPNGNLTRDTLECILANKDGKWLGKGWSDIKENNILLRKNLKFPLKGKYDFYFQQAMRHDTLKNIVNIGIRIVEQK